MAIKKMNAGAWVAMACACGAMGLPARDVQAQSVVLYGIVDSGVEYVDRMPTAGGVGSRWGLRSGGMLPSRWGIRVSEDLGAGWKALVWLENGFSVDSGEVNGAYFGRQAAMGLAHADYGRFTMGRQYTSMFDTVFVMAPMRLLSSYEPVFAMAGIGLRGNNMLKYAGESGAWRYAAHYSFGTGNSLQGGVASAVAGGELPDNSRAQTGYGASVAYLNAGTGLGVAYDRLNPAASATGPVGSDQRFLVAGSYTAGSMRYYAGVRRHDSVYPNGRTAVRGNLYWMGAGYDVNPSLSLTAALYVSQIKSASLSPDVASTRLPTGRQLALLAEYRLSKRTSLYTTAAWSRKAALNFDSLLQSGAVGYSQPSSITGLAPGEKGMFGISAGVKIVF